jgi:methylmalonyl-CoA mutase
MEQLPDKKLFTQFPPVSTQQWEEKIICDLKGADYEKKLVWKSPDGFSIRPYYRQEHIEGLEYLQSLPGEFPFTRTGKNSNEWEIRQDIKVTDISTANSVALAILERGVNSLGFRLTPDVIKNKEDFSALLKDIFFDCISFNVLSGKDSPLFLDYFLRESELRNISSNNLKGSFDFDPLGHLTTKGNYYISREEDFNTLKKIFSTAT